MADEFKRKGQFGVIPKRILGHSLNDITYGEYGSDIQIELLHQNLVKYVTYEGVKFPWRENPDYFKMKKFPWEK